MHNSTHHEHDERPSATHQLILSNVLNDGRHEPRPRSSYETEESIPARVAARNQRFNNSQFMSGEGLLCAGVDTKLKHDVLHALRTNPFYKPGQWQRSAPLSH